MIKTNRNIFKNYNNYLSSNSDLKNKNEAFSLLTEESKFNHYISTLLNGINENSKVSLITSICNRQRECLLEEAANIQSNSTALGYAVSYFPILCDMYLDDILGESITHFPYDKSIITIPRINMFAKVENSDGTEKLWKFPRAQFFIRSTPETMELIPGKTNNLIKLSKSYPNKINDKLARVNKTYFILEDINIEYIDTMTDTTGYINYNISLKPDARGQITKEIEIEHDDYILNARLIGHVNFDNATVQYNIMYMNGKPGYSYKTINIISAVIFSPKTGDIGRVKVYLENDGFDINIDIREDFEFELGVETLQEYEDIYNVNMVETLSLAIKNQFLLNRDHDIVYSMRSQESFMKSIRNYEKVNLQPYRDTFGWLSPGFISSIFQVIVPRINIVNRFVYENTRHRPQYLLTGIKTAAILESLQEYLISMPSINRGVSGFDEEHGLEVAKRSFYKQKILCSPAMDNNKIYHVFKPEVDNDHPTVEESLRHSIFVNFIYKPIYIVEEITNSIKRTFVRSRTALEVVEPQGLGVTIVEGLENLLSMWGDENFKSPM